MSESNGWLIRQITALCWAAVMEHSIPDRLVSCAHDQGDYLVWDLGSHSFPFLLASLCSVGCCSLMPFDLFAPLASFLHKLAPLTVRCLIHRQPLKVDCVELE